MKRGLDPALARQVADQLMAHDALGAHARDELGISELTTARPVQAALASAATFAVGAGLPLLATVLAPRSAPRVGGGGRLARCSSRSSAASPSVAGGSRWTAGAVRVTFWGALAMGLTYGVGALFGTTVG